MWRVNYSNPCVVVLHGNSASRISALKLVRLLIPLKLNVCAFDFSGSGMS